MSTEDGVFAQHVFFPLYLLLLSSSCSSAHGDLPNGSKNNTLEVSSIILSPLLALIVMGFLFIVFLMACIYNTAKEYLLGRDGIISTLESVDHNSQRDPCMAACGIDMAVIEEFPISAYKNVKGQFEEECAICLSQFEDEEMVRKLPMCGHFFHPECINMWLACHVTCPVCRVNNLVVPCSNELDIGPVTVIVHDQDVGEPCSPISGQTS